MDQPSQECTVDALTPQGRLLLVRRITEEGWRVADAATAAGISQRQSYRWVARYRRGVGSPQVLYRCAAGGRMDTAAFAGFPETGVHRGPHDRYYSYTLAHAAGSAWLSYREGERLFLAGSRPPPAPL